MRFIKTKGEYHVVTKATISKDDLVEVSDGRTDLIIDIEEMKFFNASENKWEGIILSHVIEHIPPFLVLECLNNIKSYLLDNGTLRILVPDPKVYFDDVESEQSPQGFKHNFISLNRLFYCWEHQFMFSDKILTSLLEELGFKEIKVTSFGKGSLAQFDANEREFESLCITARK